MISTTSWNTPSTIKLTTLDHVSPAHEWVVEHDQWKPLFQTYLACTTCTDHQIGRVLDALDASGIIPNKRTSV